MLPDSKLITPHRFKAFDSSIHPFTVMWNFFRRTLVEQDAELLDCLGNFVHRRIHSFDTLLPIWESCGFKGATSDFWRHRGSI